MTRANRKMITATMAPEGKSKAGTPIFGKTGPIKAPLYVDLAAITEAGFDPSKPVIVTITQA
jgi:hypothetical protein